ncbi:hypothetical protein D3C72_2043140 [compost metagenome]
MNKSGFYDKSAGGQQYTTFDNLFLEIRNQDFAVEIANLLCYYSGKSNRLIVIVGRAHAEGITKLLSSLGDEKIKIKYYRSDLPAEAASLMFELAQ